MEVMTLRLLNTGIDRIEVMVIRLLNSSGINSYSLGVMSRYSGTGMAIAEKLNFY